MPLNYNGMCAEQWRTARRTGEWADAGPAPLSRTWTERRWRPRAHGLPAPAGAGPTKPLRRLGKNARGGAAGRRGPRGRHRAAPAHCGSGGNSHGVRPQSGQSHAGTAPTRWPRFVRVSVRTGSRRGNSWLSTASSTQVVPAWHSCVSRSASRGSARQRNPTAQVLVPSPRLRPTRAPSRSPRGRGSRTPRAGPRSDAARRASSLIL